MAGAISWRAATVSDRQLRVWNSNSLHRRGRARDRAATTKASRLRLTAVAMQRRSAREPQAAAVRENASAPADRFACAHLPRLRLKSLQIGGERDRDAVAAGGETGGDRCRRLIHLHSGFEPERRSHRGGCDVRMLTTRRDRGSPPERAATGRRSARSSCRCEVLPSLAVDATGHRVTHVELGHHRAARFGPI